MRPDHTKPPPVPWAASALYPPYPCTRIILKSAPWLFPTPTAFMEIQLRDSQWPEEVFVWLTWRKGKQFIVRSPWRHSYSNTPSCYLRQEFGWVCVCMCMYVHLYTYVDTHMYCTLLLCTPKTLNCANSPFPKSSLFLQLSGCQIPHGIGSFELAPPNTPMDIHTLDGLIFISQAFCPLCSSTRGFPAAQGALLRSCVPKRFPGFPELQQSRLWTLREHTGKCEVFHQSHVPEEGTTSRSSALHGRVQPPISSQWGAGGWTSWAAGTEAPLGCSALLSPCLRCTSVGVRRRRPKLLTCTY